MIYPQVNTDMPSFPALPLLRDRVVDRISTALTKADRYIII